MLSHRLPPWARQGYIGSYWGRRDRIGGVVGRLGGQSFSPEWPLQGAAEYEPNFVARRACRDRLKADPVSAELVAAERRKRDDEPDSEPAECYK